MPVSFKEYPASVKNGILFLFAGWGCHYFFLYKFFQGKIPQRMLFQQIAIGLFLCFFVVMAKNWARILCILCNVLIVILYSLFCALFYGSKTDFFILSGIVAILFSVATYYLAIEESSEFFKAYGQAKPAHQDETPSDNDG
jgi:hypothetical protein